MRREKSKYFSNLVAASITFYNILFSPFYPANHGHRSLSLSFYSTTSKIVSEHSDLGPWTHLLHPFWHFFYHMIILLPQSILNPPLPPLPPPVPRKASGFSKAKPDLAAFFRRAPALRDRAVRCSSCTERSKKSWAQEYLVTWVGRGDAKIGAFRKLG